MQQLQRNTIRFRLKQLLKRWFVATMHRNRMLLYIPSNNKTNAVIYFFDPHGDGSLPVKKYKDLADKYQYVLIGSNNSKNGNDWQITENTWQNLFNDTQQRLNFDHNIIYTCRFFRQSKSGSPYCPAS